MSLQVAMFAPKSEWVPPSELPDITSASKIAIDLETCDPHLKEFGPGWPRNDGFVVGYAIAVDGWSGYLPVRHQGGGNLDERIVNKWLKRVFECPADKIMHNAQYDMGWIKASGFTLNGRVIDTMVIASLLDENRYSYSLNAVAYDYLNKTKSEKDLIEAARSFGIDPKAEMWKMPAMYVGPYAEADATLTLELWQHFAAKIETEGLQQITALELDLLPCLVDMTWRGVRVDTERVERTRDALLKREKAVLAELRRKIGWDVEIWAAQSLAKAFDELGIAFPKTEKGAPSFTKNFLADNQNSVAKLIVEARNLNKTSGTFINTIMRHCGKDGRIHAQINQIRSDDGGTVSGRVSYSSPNLQQVPARDPEMGPMIRSLFLPEEGQQWAAIDFSQQEPRILVHYAHVYGKSRGSELLGASEFVNKYRNDPATDFHNMVSDITGLPRKLAKSCGLAILYGMGIDKLSDQLDVSSEQAKAIMNQFNEKVPFVKGLSKGVNARLNETSSQGRLRSLLGRQLRFDLWEPDTFGMNKALPYKEAIDTYGPTTRLRRAYTYKALNRLIQASAADMTKQAMVNIYKTGRVPLIQIHDEIAMSVQDADEARTVAQIMETAVPLEVPSKCDVEIGPSWGEAK